jgi:hypothetical protein
MSPFSAVTFVENHDTDLNGGKSMVFNKALGYAYILTSEGYPCVYYRDYDMGPDGFRLKPQIDNLIWIHEKLANGPTQQRFKDFNVFACERLGAPGLLVGLNNDPGGPRTITVATSFGPHVRLHDYTGHAPDAVTDGAGNVTITIPQNRNGLSYVCYSGEGRDGGACCCKSGRGHRHAGWTRSRKRDGRVRDLHALRYAGLRRGSGSGYLASSGRTTLQASRIWCAANTPINAVLKPVTAGWTSVWSIDGVR